MLASSEVISPVSVLILYNWVFFKFFEKPCRNASILLFLEGNKFLHSCSHYVYFFNFNNFCSSFSSTFLLNFSCCLLLVSNQHFLFSNIYVCVINCFSCVWTFGTLWIVACQAPSSTAFSRQVYWSELLLPSPGDVPNLGLNLYPLHLLHWQEGSLLLAPPWIEALMLTLKELIATSDVSHKSG